MLLFFFPIGKAVRARKRCFNISQRLSCHGIGCAEKQAHHTGWQSQSGCVEGVPTVCFVQAYSWKICEFADEKPFGRLQGTLISVMVFLFLLFGEERQQHWQPCTDGNPTHQEHGAARPRKTCQSLQRSRLLLGPRPQWETLVRP